MRRVISLAVCLFILLSFFGCTEERDGYLELGLELPKYYESIEASDTFDAAYTDRCAVIGLIRLSFDAAIDDGIIETYSPEAFARYYKKRISKDYATVEFRGDVPYIVYTDDGDGSLDEYTYLAAFYRTRYAYFVLTCLVPSEKFSDYTEEFLSIAASAYIDYK